MMSTSGLSGPVVDAPRKPTPMETLCHQLGESLSRLREVNERQQATISRFCNEPQPAPPPNGTANNNLQPASPPPGTLGCLTELSASIEQETRRASDLANRHSDLIG